MIADGNELLLVFEALANPHRMRIVASLHEKRQYVSELAREIRLSRPLLYLHLQRLEKAGLVKGNLELSKDGKSMKYFELSGFDYHITADSIREAIKTLRVPAPSESTEEGEEN